MTLKILFEHIVGLDDRINGLDARVGNLDAGLNKKIANLDLNLSEKITNLDASLNEKISNLDLSLNRKIDDRFDEFARITNTSFQAIENRVTDLQVNFDERIDNVGKSVMAVHSITDSIFAEIKLVREEIHDGDARESVALLEDRVSVLERKIRK